MTKFSQDPDYAGLNENSTDTERLDIVFKILQKSHGSPCLQYTKLFIKDSNRKVFDAKLQDTGFVTTQTSKMNPTYEINKQGLLFLDEYHSYSNYIKIKNEAYSNINTDTIKEKELQNQINTLTLNALKRDADNSELDRKLKESQQKINELSLIKKATWKERNWLLIAFVALVVGFALDIGKEAAKKRLWPDKIESKNQIQEKSDSVLLHK